MLKETSSCRAGQTGVAAEYPSVPADLLGPLPVHPPSPRDTAAPNVSGHDFGLAVKLPAGPSSLVGS